MLITCIFVILSVTFLNSENDPGRKSEIDNWSKKIDSLIEHHPDSALQIIEEALAQKKASIPKKYKLQSKAGEIYLNRQLFEKAKAAYQNAYLHAIDLKAKELQLTVLSNLSSIERKLGNYKLALEKDLTALNIAEQIENQKQIALMLNYIGIDHYRYQNLEEAIIYFDRSLQLREKMGDSLGMADCYNNLGMVFDDQGDTIRAMKSYKMASLVYDRIQELDGQAATFNNIAGIYYKRGQYNLALDYMLKSLNIRKQEGEHYKLSYTLLNIASLYFALEKYDLAIKFNEEGLSHALKIGAKSQKRIAFEALSDIYSKKGDFEKAYHYHVKYSRIKDSIFEENKSKAIAEMETKYRAAKKDIENQLLKSENKAKSKAQLMLIILILALSIILLLILYYLRLRQKSHRQQKSLAEAELAISQKEKKHLQDKIFAEQQINRLQKEKYKKDLEHKNTRLANSTINLISKNEVLSELKTKIHTLEDRKEAMPEIVSLIIQNIDNENNWKKFSLDFETAHPGFLDRLVQHFPDLTETQIKICAYLRIELSSRSIAELLHVSLAAVNKNRQRLRKKLNLKAETNLSEFLKGL